jgi:hypothetical protein
VDVGRLDIDEALSLLASREAKALAEAEAAKEKARAEAEASASEEKRKAHERSVELADCIKRGEDSAVSIIGRFVGDVSQIISAKRRVTWAEIALAAYAVSSAMIAIVSRSSAAHRARSRLDRSKWVLHGPTTNAHLARIAVNMSPAIWLGWWRRRPATLSRKATSTSRNSLSSALLLTGFPCPAMMMALSVVAARLASDAAIMPSMPPTHRLTLTRHFEVRSSSTQVGTASLAGYRLSSNCSALSDGSKLISQVRMPSARAR